MGRHTATRASHGRAATRARPGPRTIAVVAAAALVLATGVTLLVRGTTAPEAAVPDPGATTTSARCDPALGPVGLEVVVPPEMITSMQLLADLLADGGAEVDGRCVEPAVRAAAPRAVAAQVAGTDPSGLLPDVWVSSSKAWLQEARRTPTGALRLSGQAPTVARSPLVLALPRAQAEAAGWPGSMPAWPDVFAAAADDGDLVVPDPAVSTAGLSLLMTADAVLGGAEDRRPLVAFLRAAADLTVADDAAAFATRAEPGTDARPFPATEQAVVAHNTGVADGSVDGVELVAVYPGGGQLPLEYTASVLHGTDDDGGLRVRAALRLLQLLKSPAGQDVLAQAGFRGAGGAVPVAVAAGVGALPTQTGELVVDAGTTSDRALGAWDAATMGAQVLAVVDVSGSMAATVPDGRTRLEVATAAVDFAVQLLPDSSEVGLWEFSTDLGPDGQDFVELVPIGSLADPVGGTRRSEAITRALEAMAPTNDTGLYDTALAALRTAQLAYDPRQVSSIIVLTDGEDDDDTSIGLDTLLATIAAETDPGRPVELSFVAIGSGVDVDVLRQVAAATGGEVYVTDRPEDVEQLYLDAIARRSTV